MSLKEHGYTGIEQQSKVGYLNKGIKTTGLESANNSIISDETLCHDFDGYVTLYKGLFNQSSADDIQLIGISSSIKDNSSGNDSVTFPPEYRYYGSNDWYALSKSDKDKVLKARS